MKRKSNAKTLIRMLSLVKPLAGHVCLAVLCGSLAYLAVQFIPILGGYAVISGLGYDIPISVKTIWVLLVVLAVARAVLRYTEQKTNHYIAFTLLAVVRDRVFRALRKLCPARLEGKDSGSLVSLITSDVELLEVFYAHTISPIFISIVVETVMCIYIAHFSGILALVALCAFLCVGVAVPVIVSRISGETGDEIRAQSASLSSYVLENIRGIDDTIQFGQYERRMDGMTDKANRLIHDQERLNKLSGISAAVANSFILVFDVIMVLVAMHLYRTGAVDVTGMLLSVIAMMSSFGPVAALASLGTTLQTTTASGRRILDILEETPETLDIEGRTVSGFGDVECDAVSFGYGSEEILSGLSLEMPQGRIMGITGKSGSGKSTLLKLIMRFWSPGKGSITINGRDLEDINTSDLRDMESYMTQDTYLFNDTVANNVRIAKLDATQEEIEQACRKASVHDFIMTLPKGYDTVVGDLGDKLSGGEKQRIGLARAFLHDAPLMLLDEPTSNLDSLNEAVILKSLREEAENRTVVLVSHRESTVRIADRQYHVDNGRVS